MKPCLLRRCLVVLTLLTAVRAADVVDNTVNASTDQMLSGQGSLAQAFDTGATPVQLTSITVRLAYTGSGTAQAGVELWSSAPTSTVPDTLVETLGDTVTFTNPADADYTVASPTKPLLAANARYWVVVVPLGGGTFSWRNSNDPAFTTEVGAALPSVRANNPGSGWVSFGSGNRQIVDVQGEPLSLVVTNADDSGPDSLRQALANAALLPGADTVTFDPTFFATARTIALSSTIEVNDLGGVTIDASAVAAGVTIDGGLQDFRLFHVVSGSLTLRGLTLSGGGGASVPSGGAIANDATVTLTHCTLSGNQARDKGGAIYNAGTLAVTHCTLGGNSAQYGGAIHNDVAVTLTHCTLSGNSADEDGGAVQNHGTLNLHHTVVAGNTATGSGPNIENLNSVNLTGVNFIGANISASGNTTGPAPLSGDALLGPLADNGGPTKTMLPLPGSPVLDLVPVNAEVAGLTTDQRGFPRKADADGVGSALVDLGAIEVRRVVVDTLADQLDTPTGAQTSLREALRDDAVTASADHIGFDPGVFTAGAHMIALSSAPGFQTIVVTSSVAVDASGLAKGVTIDGGQQGFRLIEVQSGGSLALRALTLTRGGGSVSPGPGVTKGGGIYNNAGCALVLERCTLSENLAYGGSGSTGADGGAIFNSGNLILTQCTFVGNQAVAANVSFDRAFGGALYNDFQGVAALAHCTLFANSVVYGGPYFVGGGAIASAGTLKLRYTIAAGNTVPQTLSGSGKDIGVGGGTLEFHGANFVGGVIANPGDAGSISGPAPLSGDAMLDPAGLADNGGPTQTIALLPDSPAIDAAAGSTFTSDQRGQPIFGFAPDLGAFEAQAAAAQEIAIAAPTGENLHSGVETVDFGAVDLGTQTPGTFTLANRGQLALTLSGTPKVAVGGAHPDDFVVTLQPVSPVAANSTTPFTLAFAPTTTGLRTATLTIASDDASEPEFEIKLSGTGQDTFTVTPIIESPSGRVLQVFDVTFTLPEAAKPGSVKLSLYDINTLTDFPVTGAANETAGSHTVTLDATALGTTTYDLIVTYQDTANHAEATSAPVTVTLRPAAPVNAKVFAAGGTTADLAPGAGTFPGLPADAKLTSFGVPAIDDRGTVAFVGKWTSASTRTKGTGLFTTFRCVALVGGDASAVGGTGATWKSFTDPVVSASRVACIATMAGVRTGTTAIVGALDDPSVLEKIARAGDAAPGASIGGATFKSFKAVTADHKAGIVRVAFLAKLTNGTGTPKVTAANDTGLWSYELGVSRFVMRESDVAAGRTIKTLVSFLPGNGSPGCGRGTLFAASTVGGTPIVSALALFTDRTQGIIAHKIDDGSPLAVSLGGASNVGLPAVQGVANPTFATYGPPARNADENAAFRAALTLDRTAGITKANASGIFAGPDGNGKFATIIRTGADAVSGAKFSALKDPVLAADGALAFPATIRGGTVRGPAMQTLWTKPAGGNLTLLAQGGADATELPGSKWKAFKSLAIAADRGPIFTATLAPRGSGAWANDFTGALRLLFNTGATVGGKKVKSFKLLSATVGSPGVTRSFNDNAQVVWLATFTDKTSAIVVTEVP